MAIEYSLLTCLGLNTAVTLNTDDTVTLAKHGMPAGHPFYFHTVGGATIDSTAISTSTKYYVQEITSTVTITEANPGVIAWAGHGLAANEIVYFRTSGTLPTNMMEERPFYVLTLDANTFKIAYIESGAAVNTTGSIQSGTHTCIRHGKFKLSSQSDGLGTPLNITAAGTGVKIVGAYWKELSDEGKQRCGWTSGDTGRVYGTTIAWRHAWYLGQDANKEVALEIQGRWIDTSIWYTSPSNGWELSGYFSILVTTSINGVRDPDAFHHSVPANGWRWYNTSSYFCGTSSVNARVTIDGIEIREYNTDTSYVYRIFQISGSLSVIKNCIGRTRRLTAAFKEAGAANQIYNCIAIDSYMGFTTDGYNGVGSIVYNNLATGCTYGFASASSTSVNFVNNLSIGNTTNWNTEDGKGSHSYNAGATGDVIWGTNSVTGLTTAIFTDYDAQDYSYVAGAAVINAGTDYKGLLDNSDINGLYRPDYESATYPSNLWDIGSFEYDHGEGNTPPYYPTVTITANGGAVSLSGAEIRIYDNDNSPAGSFGTELLGTESHGSATYIISTLNAGNEIWIQIMLTGYEEYLLKFTMPTSGTSLPITLKAEQNA